MFNSRPKNVRREEGKSLFGKVYIFIISTGVVFTNKGMLFLMHLSANQ